MNASQTIISILFLAIVASPFLIAVGIGYRYSKKVVIRFALILLICLLGCSLWLYLYGRNSSYGPEETGIMFLVLFATPVFIFTAIAFAIGQWLRKK